MKRIFFGRALFFTMLSVIFVLGCSKNDNKNGEIKTSTSENPKNLPSSGGKTLEMILVIPDEIYKGELKDSIGVYFMKACEGLSQPEPLFDVVQMKPNAFFNSEMFQKHRNVFIVDFKSTNKENAIFQKIDYKSYPQAYFQIIANNRDSLYSLITKYSLSIIHQFHNNEHRRVASAFRNYENIEITKKLKTTFNFSLAFSKEYLIPKFEDDFAWFRKDFKVNNEQKTLNIMIYKTPFLGNGMFNEEKIIELRNKISKANIPGPTRGSYMGTEERFPFYRKTVSLNGIPAVETRGLWRLYNDFMGGPFVNYCFRDEKNNQFVMIDCFLYAPNQTKRDEMMQMESIVYSLKLD